MASRTGIAGLALLLAVGACGSPDPALPAGAGPSPTPAGDARVTAQARASPSQAPDPQFRISAALGTVADLASDIGPREATGPAYRRAADLVADRLRDLGYRVREQAFRAPAGVSWGVRVPAGATLNVVATPPDLAPGAEHILVGAHLDTVPQAPGAEDNASGVAVLLELARMAAQHPRALRLPVIFVAFGAEEPRAPGDSGHHYGSRHYVEEMSQAARGALQAMVSLDRVGVGARMPVCNGGRGDRGVVRELLAAARRIDVEAQACTNRASDHWSFEKAGFPVARLGSTPYAAYHSARDIPAVIRRDQLDRAGRLAWAWLAP